MAVMSIEYGQYHVTDDTEMPDQGDDREVYPRLQVMNGSVHVAPCTFWGEINFESESLASAPEQDDTDGWDVVLEIDVHAEGEMQARPWGDAPIAILATEDGDYRLRLYAKGIAETNAAGRGLGEPLEEVLETHRLLCWPVPALQPPREIKRAVLV